MTEIMEPAPRKSLNDEDVCFEDVSMAAYRIRNGIMRTRMTKSNNLREGVNLVLKHEHRQHTGSFKERGALNAMMLLDEQQKSKGIIAASAGNHALALSYHGKRLGIPVTVVMPTFAPLAKVGKCREFGANIHLHGANIQEARTFAEDLMRESGQQYINGYDDAEIIAGAGTIGIEILEQCPDADVVIVPIGGAGLIAGVSLALKKIKPSITVIGVEPNNCDSYTQALNAGKPVSAATRPTLADGLNVPTVGARAFEIARKYVDKVVTVDEKWIALAILRILETEKMVVEGGGATGVAGILSGKLDADLEGKKVVTILCGANVDVTVLGRVIERGLFADGRLLQMDVPISDRPGGLSDFTNTVKELGCNIIEIAHERAFISDVNIVSLRATVEVTDSSHKKRCLKEMRERGFLPKVRGEPEPEIETLDTTKLHAVGTKLESKL